MATWENLGCSSPRAATFVAYGDRPDRAPGDLEQDPRRPVRRSPSSMNEQPWDFVAVTDRGEFGDSPRFGEYGAHIAGAAAAVALLSPASTDAEARETYAFDLGQAAMSMMLVAADLGIGSCHSAVGAAASARAARVPRGSRVRDHPVVGLPGRPRHVPVEHPNRRRVRRRRPSRPLVKTVIPFYGADDPVMFAIERRAMDRDGLVIAALDGRFPPVTSSTSGRATGSRPSARRRPRDRGLEPARGWCGRAAACAGSAARPSTCPSPTRRSTRRTRHGRTSSLGTGIRHPGSPSSIG